MANVLVLDENSPNHLVSLDSLNVIESPYAASERTRFLVLDFNAVTGLDATAGRTCFLSLKQLLLQKKITLVFCAVSPDIVRLLKGQQVLSEELEHGDEEAGHASPKTPLALPQCTGSRQVMTFDDLDHALQWCEEIILWREKDTERTMLPDVSENKLADIFNSYLDNKKNPHMDFAYSLSVDGLSDDDQVVETNSQRCMALGNAAKGVGVPNDIESLEKYFQLVDYNEREIIFDIGDDTDALYLVRSGEVVLRVMDPRKLSKRLRLHRYGRGGIFGDFDFFLRQTRSYRAEAAPTCSVWKMTSASYCSLHLERPDLLATFHMCLMKSMCMSIANESEALCKIQSA